MTTVFVTVGTTLFDELIFEVNKPSFHVALWIIGYRKLLVQYGNGTVLPESPSVDSIKEVLARLKYPIADRNVQPLVLESFRFKIDLESEFSAASLVISHGGAGTCLRALTPGGERRLIVVINETLMGNHQEELASALSEGKHALVTTPSKLIGLLSEDSEMSQLLPHFGTSSISELLGPSTTPSQAGFVSFQRGRPERLLNYLEMRLKA